MMKFMLCMIFGARTTVSSQENEFTNVQLGRLTYSWLFVPVLLEALG
jgi:hypothetical protein